MDKIVLKNMAFYGFHGNLASEQEQGQRFFVDVEITTDLTKAGQSDQLEDSINYVEVYDIVESVMTGEKRNLLERLGGAYCGFLVSTLPRYCRFICNGAEAICTNCRYFRLC